MSEHPQNIRNKIRRRFVLVSVGLLTVSLVSWAVLTFVEQVREAVDRAH